MALTSIYDLSFILLLATNKLSGMLLLETELWKADVFANVTFSKLILCTKKSLAKLTHEFVPLRSECAPIVSATD